MLFRSFLAALLLLIPIHKAIAAEPLHHIDDEVLQLRKMLPPSKPFDEWLTRSSKLVPEFDALPAMADPPDIFTTIREGKPHRITREEWPARRKEMRKLLEDWLLGHAPPGAQDVRAVIEDKMHEADKDIWQVRLEFGPDHAAKLHCWLWMSPNLKKPAPVFLVDNFKYTKFAADALAKGTFAVCVYNAPDPAYIEFMPPYVKDRKDESDTYKDSFGNYDWSEFYRRGWSASRAVDWLSTLDFIDAKRIYIGGHSRSAKQAMAAAAFDDRIAGVIASSPGSGGSLCYRYCDQYYYGESAELLTRVFPQWVSPRVRCFVGRENKLPADTHFEYALIAPRPVLMSTAINDDVENTWAVERTYDLVHPVWEFLGEPGNLAVRYRAGPHAPDDATYHAHSDFLETVAAGKSPAELFPYHPIHVWNYEKWTAENKPTLDIAQLPDRTISDSITDSSGKPITAASWPGKRDEIRAQINWLLGDGPAYEPIKPDFSAGESDEEAKRLHRADPDHQRIQFGDHINANLYRPLKASKLPEGCDSEMVGQTFLSAIELMSVGHSCPPESTRIRSAGQECPALADSGRQECPSHQCQITGQTTSNEARHASGKHPAIIWLAPLQTSMGYVPGYKEGDIPYPKWVKAGYSVLAFDPIATGGRQEERRDFYDRYPHWSLMGKMVLDARHAIDAVLADPDVDPQHIYLVGFGMGGMVATLTEALDDRIAGAASIAGFTPFRTDTDASGTGGIRRLSELYGWLPRLGPFIGHEAKIPVDFNEILAAAAPKPILTIAPTLDWHENHADVEKAVEAANIVYTAIGPKSSIMLYSPEQPCQFDNDMQVNVIEWLRKNAGP